MRRNDPLTATSLDEATAPALIGFRLFALSFAALFLELMVIRWVPSEVRLVAYYANLMLVSSFLGLGIGAMISSRNWRLFRWFGPLFMIDILLLVLLSKAVLPGGSGEWRFQDAPHPGSSYAILVAIFLLNAITFIPLGDEIGRQFHRLPALRAYAWDLGGSLAGTLAFGAFSLLYFSPILGMTGVALLVLALGNWKQRVWAVPCYAVALGAVFLTSQGGAYWSPYHFITVHENFVSSDAPLLPGDDQPPRLEQRPALAPPPDVRTMRDPPIYTVRVNQDFYQFHGTLDVSRYTYGSWQRDVIRHEFPQYSLPYQFVDKLDRVLVLGAGGGFDVEAGLLNGAKKVDAVEIDPLIARLSNRFAAAAPYENPKVVLHVDDARAFLQKNTDQYDLVVFGFLDSQALFSYGASIRLDGYTYTVESFRKAFEHVRQDGGMAVSFYAGNEWLARKLMRMMYEGTGVEPHVYLRGGKIVMVATKTLRPQIPKTFFNWELTLDPIIEVPVATDDWPYLYLENRGVPRDYAMVIGTLLVISMLAVLWLRGGSGFGSLDLHFLFMGWGFLLLQTKSIGDCSLYFGTTWFVTTLVIAGVLLMVLLANWVAIQFIPSFHRLLYLPLFASLAILLFVPRELILGQSFTVRLLWTLLAVPLPIFFAGLIFSTTFREGANPSALFGANLIGATIGGFCEYLGMWIGSQALGYIVIGAYVASLACVTLARLRRHPRQPSAANIEAAVA